MADTRTLVLLRHGESAWNRENRFTGWVDVDLNETGVSGARAAGRLLAAQGFTFDVTHTSILKRAIRTLHLALEEMDALWLPVEKSWRLNERHYGALQGLDKSETAAKHGEAQVKVWRRSWDVPPPPMPDDAFAKQRADARFAAVSDGDLPRTECLKDTVTRFLPYWHERIAPQLSAGKRVLVVAHGNSLRALVKYLDGMTDAEIVDLNIPTAQPLLYELDGNLRKVSRRYLDPEAAKRAAEEVANQAKTKFGVPPSGGS